MKSTTGIHRLMETWRKGKAFDAYRIALFKDSKQHWISAKINPTLQKINLYLCSEKLHKDDALRDNNFQRMKQLLFAELKQEHSLSQHRSRERVSLTTKEFNFEQSIDEFAAFKGDTSVPEKHRSILTNVWIPFFLGKGCKHPTEFLMWRTQAQKQVRIVMKVDGSGPYSVHSRVSLTNSFNEYMKWLRDENGSIKDNSFFTLSNKVTADQLKRGLTKQSRKRDTYNEDDLLRIKELIDAKYQNDALWKLRAYAMYFGICTGLRRGNLLGLRVRNLHPDADVPHFETGDNIVDGWSRGLQGAVILEACSKTFVGTVLLPFVQPSIAILCEIARHLKENLRPDDRLLDCGPSTVAKWWEKVARDCGFKFLSPHDWRHSYATVGSRHIHDWYRGNAMFLKDCCMHQDLRTTNKYVNQKGQDFLKAFGSAKR